MKKYIYAIIVVCCMTAHAQSKKDIKLEAERVSISQLIEVAYAEIFKERQYLIDSSVLQLQNIGNLRINAKNHEELQNTLSAVMAENGIVVQKRGKLDYITMLESHRSHWLLNTELITYKPKNRSASYIREVLSSVLPAENIKITSGGQQSGRLSSGGQPQQQQSGGGIPQNQVAANSVTTQSAGADLVIVRASTALERQKIEALLETIDTAIEQVSVEAILIEVGLNDQEGSAVAAALQALDGKIDISIGQAGSGGTYAALKLGGLQAVVKALTTKSNFRIMSTSTLSVQNGKTARLQVGSEVPVLGALQYTNGSSGQPVQSVEYRPSGVLLNITPEIRGQSIEISVQQQISEFVQTMTGVSASPTKQTREIQTSLMAADGGLVMLGGLTSEKSSTSKNGIFGFTLSNEKSGNRSEVLLVMRVKKLEKAEKPSA